MCITLLTYPSIPITAVHAQSEPPVVAVNSSGTYLRVPILETNISFAGVTFFAYMPDHETVALSFTTAVNTNIDVYIYDLNMNPLASRSYQIPANTTTSHSISLPRQTTYTVISLTINGYRAPLYVVRVFPQAEQLTLSGYGQYQTLITMLSGLMVATPVLGLLLRGMPRAGALLTIVLSWALLTVMTYFATAVGVDMKIVYAVLGVTFAYSVFAFTIYRKG
jgi:hypothetical protein